MIHNGQRWCLLSSNKKFFPLSLCRELSDEPTLRLKREKIKTDPISGEYCQKVRSIQKRRLPSKKIFFNLCPKPSNLAWMLKIGQRKEEGARSHVCARFPSFLLPRSEDSLSRAAHSQRGGAGEKRRTNFRPVRRRTRDGRRERKERRRRNFAARGGGGDITTHRPSLSYSPPK